jgi:hypothetical protein
MSQQSLIEDPKVLKLHSSPTIFFFAGLKLSYYSVTKFLQSSDTTSRTLEGPEPTQVTVLPSTLVKFAKQSLALF